MSCTMYESYELGEIEEQTFAQHLEACESCRKRQRLDMRLLAAARSLKEPVDAPGLWERIEADLTGKQTPLKPPTPGRFNRRFQYLAAAAVVLTAMAIGVFFGVFLERSAPGLLSDSALGDVQRTEQHYMAAISRLEEKARPRMEKMDIELMLLYKDRLAVIDIQIRDCKDALSQNPANSHIRRYLLSALQDKKETLNEILRPGLNQHIPGN